LRSFAEILRARSIPLEHATEQKQTDTTPGWKLGLVIAGAAVPLPTRIEFPRRGLAPSCPPRSNECWGEKGLRLKA
jgi:hypothetical protein